MNHRPNHNPPVRQQRRHKAEVRAHHLETVAEALAMALFGDAAHKIVGRDKAGVHGYTALFQDFNAPVVVGAEVVFDERRHDGQARDEGLVHYQHPAEKLAPVELDGKFTSAELAHGTNRQAFRVHEHRFAVKHIGFGGDEGGHFFQNIGRMDVVAAIEAPHKIASGDAHPLVHGIVQPFVRLGNPADVGHCRREFLYDFQRVVFGGAVHEDVFNVRVSLPPHTFHRAGQVGLAIIDDSDDGESDWFLVVTPSRDGAFALIGCWLHVQSIGSCF